MSFSIVTTPPFEKELKQLAKKYPSVKKDIADLAVKLLKEPKMGIALGNDVIKSEWQLLQKEKENLVEPGWLHLFRL